MSDEKKGIEAARAKAAEIKAEVQAEADAKDRGLEQAKNQLEAIHNNPELAQMYSENAQVGASNIAGALPLLKVHAVGRSKNELADGTEPKDGAFFYKPTGEEFDSVDVHILTISRGFRAKGMEGSDRDDVFNQIVGGCIVDGTDYKPFMMYFTGLKLSYLWEFGKAASKYTHAKPIPIPMFALTVRLTTKKIDNSFGKSWIVEFEIVKSEDHMPKLVMDPGEFTYLKDSVETIESTIENIVARKAGAEVVEKLQEVREEPEPSDPVDGDNIPF